MDPALRLRGLTKTFGHARAVDGLDLVVPRGATYGVIGPSGAGKTTCIRMIMSILFPDSGELTVLGHASALDAKDRIGYLPEERGVYRRMRVGDFVAYIAQLKGVEEEVARPRAARLLARLDLEDIERKRCDDMSKGMLQRIQFVAAIINEPELLILDEPFSGLDPVSVRLLRELIADEQRRGATVLFSTHVMAHAEDMCQHIVMIHQGRKVLDEPMAGLRRQFDLRLIHFEPLDPAANLEPLRRVAGVEGIAMTDEGCDVRLLTGTDPAGAMRSLAAAIPAARIELSRLRLEDVFIRLVAESARGAHDEQALRANLQGLGAQGAAL
jgi:ABC-2 type transport system ATP-binding protein